MNAYLAAAAIPALLLGHIVSGEYSPIRLFLMKVFARYIEVPVLHLSYLACVGRLHLQTSMQPAWTRSSLPSEAFETASQ